MLQLSSDICALFEADRLTIYTVGEDKSSIVTKIKTGLGAFKDFKLPISSQSVAGYVALNKSIVNIRDVYDDEELKTHHPGITFLKDIDRKSGYRTKTDAGGADHRRGQRRTERGHPADQRPVRTSLFHRCGRRPAGTGQEPCPSRSGQRSASAPNLMR